MPDNLLRPSRAGARLSSHRGASGLGSRKGSHSSVIRGSKAQIGVFPGHRTSVSGLVNPVGALVALGAPPAPPAPWDFHVVPCHLLQWRVRARRASRSKEQGARRKAGATRRRRPPASGRSAARRNFPSAAPRGSHMAKQKAKPPDPPPAAQQGPALKAPACLVPSSAPCVPAPLPNFAGQSPRCPGRKAGGPAGGPAGRRSK
jgi:hypothetical protein